LVAGLLGRVASTHTRKWRILMKPRLKQTAKSVRSQIKISPLVNRAVVRSGPSAKKRLDATSSAQGASQPVTLPLDRVGALVPGAFVTAENENGGVGRSENGRSQHRFFRAFEENIRLETLEAFGEARPFRKQKAGVLTEPLRSRGEAPEERPCQGRLRVRVVFGTKSVLTTNGRSERRQVV